MSETPEAYTAHDFKQELPLLRTSERTTFMRCPQAWYWGHVEGLTPIVEKKVAADFGTGIHLALAEWYKYPGDKPWTAPRR